MDDPLAPGPAEPTGSDGLLGGVLGDAPTIFLLVVTVISVAFVALPTWFAFTMVRDRRRRSSWTPTTARLLSSQVQRRGSGDSRRVVVIGRWAYRDAVGVEQTGQGDLSSAWVDRGPDGETLQVLVDPADPSRSQPLRSRQSVVGLVVVSVVMAAFFLVGLALLTTAVGVLLG